MTTQSVQPIHHISPKAVGLGLAGALLAVGAGVGVYALATDEVIATPGPGIEYPPAQPGSDAYEGWNRETRELQHRR